MKLTYPVLIVHIVAMIILAVLVYATRIGEEVFCTLFGMLVGYWIGQGRGMIKSHERSSNSTS